MNLALSYSDNGTGHEDVFFRFCDRTFVGDSFYFRLDRELLPGQEDDVKVLRVLVQLLKQWRRAAEDARDDEMVYLPFDFSDQCTRWLKCRRVRAELEIRCGWSTVEGWSFFPSNIQMFINNVPDFREEGLPVFMSIGRFVDQITASINALEQQPRK